MIHCIVHLAGWKKKKKKLLNSCHRRDINFYFLGELLRKKEVISLKWFFPNHMMMIVLNQQMRRYCNFCLSHVSHTFKNLHSSYIYIRVLKRLFFKYKNNKIKVDWKLILIFGSFRVYSAERFRMLIDKNAFALMHRRITIKLTYTYIHMCPVCYCNKRQLMQKQKKKNILLQFYFKIIFFFFHFL